MDFEEPGDEVKVKQEQAVHLIAELKQSMKCVLGDAIKLGGEPLGDGVYTLTLFCALVEQALGHGLKESSRARWPFWGAGKAQFSFFNVLEFLEQSMSEKGAFRGSLGLDAVRGLTWVRSSLGQLRAWLRLSLNAGLLGARIRFMLEDSDLLEQWYENWAVLRTENASEELVSLIMSLDAVGTCLSVSESLALDHQKFVISDRPSGQVTHSHSAKPDTNEPRLSHTNFAAAHELTHPSTLDVHDGPGDVDAVLEQKVRGNRKGSSKKRFISVLDEDEHGQRILGRLEQGGQQKSYASLYHESIFHAAAGGWQAESPEGSSPSHQKGPQQAGMWQDGKREKAVDEALAQEGGGRLKLIDSPFVLSSPEDSDFFHECLNSADEQTIAGWSHEEEVGDGQLASPNLMERTSETESLPGTSGPPSSLAEGAVDGATDICLALEDDAVTFKRDSSPVHAVPLQDFDDSIFTSSVKAEVEDAGPALEEKYQIGEADLTNQFIQDLATAKHQSGSGFAALQSHRRTELSREEPEGDWSGEQIVEHAAVLESPSANGDEGRERESASESDVSISGTEEAWTSPSHRKQIHKMFSLCRKLEDELAFGASDWDDYEQSRCEAATFGDASTAAKVRGGLMENSNLSPPHTPLGAMHKGKDVNILVDNFEGAHPLSQETGCGEENLTEEDNDAKEMQTSIQVIGFGDAGAGEGISAEGCVAADNEFALKDPLYQGSPLAAMHKRKDVNILVDNIPEGAHPLSQETGCGEENVNDAGASEGISAGGSAANDNEFDPLLGSSASHAVYTTQVTVVETHRIVSDVLEQDSQEVLLEVGNNSARLSESLLPSRTPLFQIPGSHGEESQSDGSPLLNDEVGLASQSASFQGCEAELPSHGMDSSLHEEAISVSSGKGRERNVFSAIDVFGLDEGENAPVASMQGTRRKGCVVRLGSKEAEDLLQLDVTKLGRASSQSMQGDSATPNRQPAFDWGADDLGPDEVSRYVEKLEVQETYMDTVLDMENVLLEADDSTRSRIFQDANGAGSSYVRSDGGQYASPSGFQASSKVQPATSRLKEVVWVEVIGARQRRGGASLGERVVGVQEHTVYRILAKGIDSEWEIERRYRDFVLLHNKLVRLFRSQSGFFLPAPWDKVKGESRKVFGNTSPNVVEVRSALIQVCLQSLILAGAPLKTAGPLLAFLSSDDGVGWSSTPPLVNSPLLDQKAASQLPLEDFLSAQSQSPRSDTVSSVAEHDQDAKASTVFGKTIRLIVQVHTHKPLRQQLHSQHHACAGCYKHLVSATGLVPSFVQTLGLAGPRLCEYSGQLFCSECHSNEVAVIPAQVLQNWDFTPRKVSQLAKAYLDSIYDQPMLCVSAVNPYLYSRVPILANVRDMRKKLSRLVACLNCSGRSRILAMFGSRRYLVENNDFFALRDLADLSKGAFSVLPGFMKTARERVYVHITRDCSVCYETGESCGAGEWCDDPFDTIFPFQDDNVTRCPNCQLPFHNLCFTSCSECPSCHGRPPPARLADGTPSSSGCSTGESSKELTARIRSSLFSTSDSGQRPRSSKRRSSKQSSHAGVKGNRSNSLVLNMSALSAPLEL